MRLPKWFQLAAVVAPTIGATAATAQSPAGLFSRLEGTWVGEGTLMRRTAAFDMKWEVRPGGYAILTFGNAFVDSLGTRTPVLNAIAVYRTDPANAEAAWFDSRGVRIRIDWVQDGPTLTANWHADSENGQTVYRVVSADRIEVEDYVATANGLARFGGATYRPAAAAMAPGLAPVRWLQGCWRRERNGRVIDEQWMAPAGNGMLGMSRTVREGTISEYEFVRLQVVDGTLSYIANPSGQAEASFPLERIAGDSVIFANPAHDFPQRIGYRPVGTDSLMAWIEGPSGGATRTIEFPMARVTCPGR